MRRSGPDDDPSPDMSERDLAELVAQVWERAGYPTAVEYHDGKTFVVAGTSPESAALVWVVPAHENQKLAASWIGVYEAMLEDLVVGRPYLVTTGGASDEAERAADRSDVVLVDRDNLETLLRQSGIGTERLETPTSKASPSPPPDEASATGGAGGSAGGLDEGEPAGQAAGMDGTLEAGSGVGVGDDSAAVGMDDGSAGEGGAMAGVDEERAGAEDGSLGTGAGGGDDGGVAMTFGDDGEMNDLTDDSGGGGTDDGGGMAMTFGDDGEMNDLTDDGGGAGGSGGDGDDDGGVAMVFDDDGGVTDLTDEGGDSGGSGGGGSSGLDSILDDDEEPAADEAEGTSSRRRFVTVGLGVIGVSVLGIVDRLWLHFVLGGGGGGGLPSYNETRVKQQATTLATGNLVTNAESLTTREKPFAVQYEGVVMGTTGKSDYQRLNVMVESGERNLVARWDGDPLSQGAQVTLWGVFVDTEAVDTEDGTTERPVVDVVDVSVTGGPGVSAGGTTTG